MKKAVLGAMLSGLVFPGAGQIVLKHTRRGIFFMVITTMGLLGVVYIAVQKALLILNQLPLESGIMDYRTLYDAAEKALSLSDGRLFSIALGLLLVTWLFSTLDAYRLGKRMDEIMDADKPFDI